jgi:glutathione S-transferase
VADRQVPVLRDDATDRTIPESGIIIEYLDNQYPGQTRFIPADAKQALQTRLRDRFCDLYVHLSVQKIAGDRLRPKDGKDPHGVEEAKARIQSCYGIIDKEVAAKTWAMGDAFSIADCAASPALFYANKVVPFGDTHSNLTAYFDRLKARPCFARVIKEAEPCFHIFPQQT